MTRLEFMALCGERLIDVGLALENDAIAMALKKKDDELVKTLLDSEF